MNMISIFYFFLCGYNSIIIVFANDYCKIYPNAATFVFLPFSTDSLHTFPFPYVKFFLLAFFKIHIQDSFNLLLSSVTFLKTFSTTGN